MIKILFLLMISFNIGADLDNKDKITIDLGEHEVGEIVTHNVSFLDMSDFLPPYQIEGKSCKCIDVKLSTDSNDVTHLKTQLRVNQAGLQAGIVLIRSETSKVVKEYDFLVHGKEAFSRYPFEGYFNVKSSSDEYIITLTYFTMDKDANAVFEKIETNIPGLTCGQVDSKQVYDEDNKLKVFEFQVPLLYQINDKKVRKTFSEEVNFLLKTSNGARLILYPLTIVTGKYEYKLTPEKIFLLCSRTSSKKIDKSVKLKFEDDQDVKSLSISQKGSLPIKIESQQNSEQEYLLHVNVIPDKLQLLSPGTKRGEIVVQPDDTLGNRKIIIPVTMVISE